MSLVDKLTRRMKKVSGDLLIVLDRNDEATVGAVVASLKAGSGTSRRNNLPPHRVGAKWLEEIRQQAVVRRGHDLLEQFDEGTIRAQSTLSPMLTAAQIRARWGSATVVGRGGVGRLGSHSAVSALEEEGAVHRVMPRPSVGTHSLYKSSGGNGKNQKKRPQSAVEKRMSDLTAAVASGQSALADKRGRWRRKGRRRPMSASMLGLADRKDDGEKNDRVLAMIRDHGGMSSSPSSRTPLHVPAAVPLTNPRSSSKFGGRLPGHARFEALQRQGSAMLERLRKELRETRDDGIHTDGGNRLRDPAVGDSVRELGKLYSSLYEGVHGSLNLMFEHMHFEEGEPRKMAPLESVAERKRNRKKKKKKKRPRSSRGRQQQHGPSRRRPKSAVIVLGAGKSFTSKSDLVQVDEDDADDAGDQLLDDDDLSGIKDLRGGRGDGNRGGRRRPRTAGLTGIREVRRQGGDGRRSPTERNICTPTRSNSVRREKRRDLQYQAAIDKYRQYDYEDGGPRVEKAQGKGVFNVYN